MSTQEFNQLLVTQNEVISQFARRFVRTENEVNDLAQETFLKALRFQNHFVAGTNLKGWLYTMMRNIFINQYNKSSFQNTFVDRTEGHYFLNQASSDQASNIDRRLMRKDLDVAIGNLDDRIKVPFERFVEGYKYEEIAKELELPVGTIKSRIHQARQLLKASLAQYAD
jgi:RNA polymerase sigma-70 factor, ECF subfamily